MSISLPPCRQASKLFLSGQWKGGLGLRVECLILLGESPVLSQLPRWGPAGDEVGGETEFQKVVGGLAPKSRSSG